MIESGRRKIAEHAAIGVHKDAMSIAARNDLLVWLDQCLTVQLPRNLVRNLMSKDGIARGSKVSTDGNTPEAAIIFFCNLRSADNVYLVFRSIRIVSQSNINTGKLSLLKKIVLGLLRQHGAQAGAVIVFSQPPAGEECKGQNQRRMSPAFEHN